jgi:hypothetical protein
MEGMVFSLVRLVVNFLVRLLFAVRSVTHMCVWGEGTRKDSSRIERVIPPVSNSRISIRISRTRLDKPETGSYFRTVISVLTEITDI